MEETKEQSAEFQLSLPLGNRDMSLLHNISSAHMDPVIHMCFLRKKFALDIWEKYMEHIFYDEFLAHMVWRMLDQQEEKDPETVKQLQTIYQTIYMRTREKTILREVERVVKEEGQDRESVLLVLREELESRIDAGGEEHLIRIHEMVDRMLERELVVHRDDADAKFDTVLEKVLTEVEEREKVSGKDRESLVVFLHQIREHVEREMEKSSRTERIESRNIDVSRELILRTLERMEEQENREVSTHLLRDIREKVEHELSELGRQRSAIRMPGVSVSRTGVPERTVPGSMPSTGADISGDYENGTPRVEFREIEKTRERSREVEKTGESPRKVRAALERIPEAKAAGSSESADEVYGIHPVEEGAHGSETTEELFREPGVDESSEGAAEASLRETILQLLDRIEEKEIREFEENEIHLSTREETSAESRIRNRETVVNLLHRIRESVEGELSGTFETGISGNGTPESGQSESTAYGTEEVTLTDTETTIETGVHEVILRLLERIEEREIREFDGTELYHLTREKTSGESRTWNRRELVNLLHRVREETSGVSTHSERRHVNRTLTRETITRILNRVEAQMTYEWEDVERLAAVAPLYEPAVPGFVMEELRLDPVTSGTETVGSNYRLPGTGHGPALRRAQVDTTRLQADRERNPASPTLTFPAPDRVTEGARSDDFSDGSVAGAPVAVMRELGDAITEIHERAGEEETVIMGLKNDLKEAETEIQKLRAQNVVAEKVKAEEKRDAYQEEKVKDLFDNSMQLERLRNGV